MTLDPELPTAAPKWARMPGAVRLKLDQAIAEHLRVHRSRFYDLLRDDPRFAPWIGTHLGARGEKRLDRAIAEVRRVQKQKMARKAAPVAGPADDADDFAPLDPPRGPAQRLATAGAAALSYEEFQERSGKRLRQLGRLIDDIVDEDGKPTDPRLFAQLLKQEQALQAESVQLSKSYYADLNTKDVMQGVLARLAVELAANPERAPSLMHDINDVFRRANGLAAIKGNGS
jgi:hypothetical protein